METRVTLDRLAMRARPEGTAIMAQNWEQLLFLHWPVAPETLRPHVPAELEIDTYENQAWITITPFALTGLHLTSLPPVPGLDSFHELNVRTYVHYRGKPGIYFFSLDASKAVPAIGARLFFMAPYHAADIEYARGFGSFHFDLQRRGSPGTYFRAKWKTGPRLREPHLESLAFFLVERYGFFVRAGNRIILTRIYHHPWILEEANEVEYESTMIRVAGMDEPTDKPLAHFSTFLNVEVWPPTDVT